MLNNEAQVYTPAEALRATSWTSGANNGAWIDVRNFEGQLNFIYTVGAVTGTMTYKVQDATDIGGTGSADLSPAVTTTALGTAGTTGVLRCPKGVTRGFVRIVGTVATGPALGSVVLEARNKLAS